MPWSTMNPGVRRLTLGLLGLLTLATLICVARPLVELPLQIGRNNNEGWNAHHTTDFMSGEPLYRSPDDLVSTTYPPLSFLIVGALSGSSGDALLVGRVVALLGLLVTASCVSWIVYLLTRSVAAAWFSGVLAVGAIGAHSQNYVAMDDPQFLGHAFQYLGLGLFLVKGHRRGAMALSVLLLLAGGLVKHNLLPVPLCLGAWLLIRRRREFLPFFLTALVLTALTLAGIGWMFGPRLFGSILDQSRTYDVYLLVKALQRWYIPITPLLLGGVAVLFLPGRDARTSLFVAMAAVSLGLSVALSLAEGMAINAIFDLVFALAILCGVTLHGVAISLPAGGGRTQSWIVPVVMVAMFSNIALITPWWAYKSYEIYSNRDRLQEAAREDIAFVAGQPGAVMCEDPAISYWAGKPFGVDFFDISQKVRSGRLDESLLAARIAAQDFVVIQVDREWGSDLLSDAANAAILKHYRLARTSSANGYFYVPRESSTISGGQP